MKNYKSLSGLILLIFLCSSVFAKMVDIKDARTVALNYHSEKASIFDNTSKAQQIVLAHTETEQNIPVYYIFNINSNSFVIVSAEDRYYPVLGFSFEGNYNPLDIAPAFSNWLEGYENKILQIRSSKTLADAKTISAWNRYLNKSKITLTSKEKSIPPLIKSKWGQGTNYNDSCPVHTAGPNGHCVAGCVSIVMAQLMYYYKFPSQGIGSHSYYHPYYVNISANFGNTNYDFSKMTNTINSSSKAEIAQLIAHSGVAVDMYYTPSSSGANMYNAMSGMVQYFNYSIRAFYKYKSNLSDSAWVALLKNDLESAKPVLYAGSGSAGGHAFVCDGYVGDDKFHFNWGWNGSNDGYFFLDNFDFSSSQSAIFNLVPYGHDYCTGDKTYNYNEFTFDDGSGPSKYWDNTNCEWLIAPNNGLPISLNFVNFDTESGNDIVTVYDGASKSDPVLGTYSGSSLPPALTSTGNKMLITFESNGSTTNQGWMLHYSSLPVGVDENSISAYLKIYPNPAEDNIKIDFGGEIKSNISIQLLDITGKVMIGHDLSFTKTANLDVSNLSSGIYLLKIKTENEIVTKKVCVK